MVKSYYIYGKILLHLWLVDLLHLWLMFITFMFLLHLFTHVSFEGVLPKFSSIKTSTCIFAHHNLSRLDRLIFETVCINNSDFFLIKKYVLFLTVFSFPTKIFMRFLNWNKTYYSCFHVPNAHRANRLYLEERVCVF